MIIAISTNDGRTLTNGHFGEGNFFILYGLENGETREIRKIENTSAEEHHHGDDMKAGQIGQLLKDADVLVGKAFGPNIVKMRKTFAVVVSQMDGIDETLMKLTKMEEELKRAVESEPKGILYAKGD